MKGWTEIADTGAHDKGLECGVCMNPFEEDGIYAPVVLPCGHSVCQGCGTGSSIGNQSGNLFCPFPQCKAHARYEHPSI